MLTERLIPTAREHQIPAQALEYQLVLAKRFVNQSQGLNARDHVRFTQILH